MYLPQHFEQTDPAQLTALMRAHPLATLVSVGDGGPVADHIPLEFDPGVGASGCLRGHVARANPLWRQAAGKPVLAVFNGPQAYISPSHYPSKAQTHKVVPTWNYAVVHAQGLLRVVEDAPWLHTLVSRLTAHHETPRSQPWAVTDAPDDYVQQMLRAIVGIEIPITSLVGKWKLSQNRSLADLQGVIDGLAQGDAAALATAAWMRQARDTP
jgi:transcriptional regulator